MKTKLTILGIALGLGSFLILGAVADVRPNATATEANGSCTTSNAHTNMDDDADAGGDGNVCNASSNTADHDIRLNFATPTGNPSTGADLQTFALLAVNSQPTANGNPTVTLNLYCNGALVEAGTSQQIGDTLAILTETFTFNAGSCASNGSDVEVFIDCTARNVGGTSNDASCNYEAVEWRVDIPDADVTAPTPNPATFVTVPSNDSATQISMTATTASDATTPIEHQFAFVACDANGGTGGTSSAWQQTTSYSDGTLQPNKCYGYTIQSRDSVTPTPNTGTASTRNITYTSANVPNAPAISVVTTTTFDLANDANSNPASAPTTNFAVQIVNTSDVTWNNKYVDTNGDPSATAVWMSDAVIDALTVSGLDANTSYDVQVKARNEDTDETSFGTATTQITGAVGENKGLRLRAPIKIRGGVIKYR